MSIYDVPDHFLSSIDDLKGVITVVINDATRPSSERFLCALQKVLTGRTRFLFATGTHRAVTEKESREILGNHFSCEAHSISNFCDDGTHRHIGTTSRGTEVEIHPWVAAGSVLALNTVEPHYFAGYTGGRKSILPGVSSRRTVTGNHYLACLPGALPGRLHENPVHEDMMEGIELLSNTTELLMINSVAGKDVFFCGGHSETFYSAAEVAGEVCGVPVPEKYHSLEIRPGRSLEQSLYQAMKAIFMWECAVEDGGNLVLAAECSEGLGAPQMNRLLRTSISRIAVPATARDYILGDHAAIRLQKIRSRLKLSFRTGIDLDRFGFESPPESCDKVVENAGFTIPVMGKGNA